MGREKTRKHLRSKRACGELWGLASGPGISLPNPEKPLQVNEA
jgi:hypothetical protein